ncbi:MAG: hypothetical protein GZ085_03805 [Sulfuriferula multivorans]|uniref:Integrase SAM-like N-terminal domain-containing protein n=1 Tax=Sulfuriferula multivorans TaxID=1559896 RepID=A0A7C9K9U1_9PROT|nr:hypothetical protein [Sulfuriferula multivorans]
MQLKHCSLRTEQAYVQWAKRYLIFHGKRHPAEMKNQRVENSLAAALPHQTVHAVFPHTDFRCSLRQGMRRLLGA